MNSDIRMNISVDKTLFPPILNDIFVIIINKWLSERIRGHELNETEICCNKNGEKTIYHKFTVLKTAIIIIMIIITKNHCTVPPTNTE